MKTQTQRGAKSKKNSQGFIVEKAGANWALCEVSQEDGRMKKRTVAFFPSEQEAEAAAREFK